MKRILFSVICFFISHISIADKSPVIKSMQESNTNYFDKNNIQITHIPQNNQYDFTKKDKKTNHIESDLYNSNTLKIKNSDIEESKPIISSFDVFENIKVKSKKISPNKKDPSIMHYKNLSELSSFSRDIMDRSNILKSKKKK